MPKKPPPPPKKGERRALGNKGGARPSLYKAEYADLAYNYTLLGATREDIAGFLGVGDATLWEWEQKHPKFSAALRAGKDEADALVARRLYTRATGYERVEEKVVMVDGKPELVKVKTYYPPDIKAATFWLVNRDRGRGRWKHRQDISHGTQPGDPLEDLILQISGKTSGLPSDDGKDQENGG